MGKDKATVEFLGLPLIAHAIRILQGADLPVLIAGDRPDLQSFAQVVNDTGSSGGPLGGICGALEVTSVTSAVFVPVDLPLLPSELIRLMQKIAYVTGHVIVVSSVNGYVQTFPAVLSRATLPFLKAELEAGRGGCFSAFDVAAKALGQQLHVVCIESLAQAGQLQHPNGLPVARWFFNINSTADLQRAQTFRTGKFAERG
jgi:molybdenum cofactor guanylyltransferase